MLTLHPPPPPPLPLNQHTHLNIDSAPPPSHLPISLLIRFFPPPKPLERRPHRSDSLLSSPVSDDVSPDRATPLFVLPRLFLCLCMYVCVRVWAGFLCWSCRCGLNRLCLLIRGASTCVSISPPPLLIQPQIALALTPLRSRTSSNR